MKTLIQLLTFTLTIFFFLNSYQTKAQCHIDDWTALKALYESTDGDNWGNKYGWEIVKHDEPPLDCNLAYLEGVGLDDSGRVELLYFDDNNLNGSLPPELGKLTHLKILDLYENYLRGDIPRELGNLNMLTKLNIGYCYISGSVPAELGDLSNLTWLSLGDNNLTGSIPPELGNLSSLEFLFLGGNQLSGNIPATFSSLRTIQQIGLQHNQLSGSIPSEIGNLSNLIRLLLNNNQLSGNIPPEMGNLTKMRFLELRSNQLSGSIPPELGNFEDVFDFDLRYNQLSGSIPPGLGNMTCYNLLLGHNNLSGNIPVELGNIVRLFDLDLSHNLLSGSIPPELAGITELNLSYNQLSGSIPSALGSTPTVGLSSRLDLRSNQLSGSIPPELTDLVVVNLSYNQLSGNIPPGLTSGGLFFLYITNNQLSGNIPAELGSGNLSILDLSFNQLSGNIPAELSSIGDLDLSDNQLSGNIPTELSEVHELNLSSNQFKGSIPPELNGVSYLNLSSNQFSGNIPVELREVNSLNLSFNQLSGNIPSELSEVGGLSLSNNQLSGSIPLDFFSSNELYFLDLSNNQLTGSIPIENIGTRHLRRLRLSHNQLTGNIPAELIQFNNLENLYLNDNQFTGSIPEEFTNLERLRNFDVSNNQLSGTVPQIGRHWFVGIDLVDISLNYFQCQDLLNYNPKDTFTVYNYTPQKYEDKSEQSFLINSSEESISLSAPFSQSGGFTYQWYKDELQIENATDSILYLNSVQFEDVGNYTLKINDASCMNNESISGIQYVSDQISVRRIDLEGCTDINSCNYNELAMINNGSCEYLWCNPINIQTTNEVVLSDTQIKFDIVVDSLGLDYSANGLTFSFNTWEEFKIESIDVVNPVLSITEVDKSKLNKNVFSINRVNGQLIASNQPLVSVIATIDMANSESDYMQLIISGGTELANRSFIHFENVYVDIPFKDCSLYMRDEVNNENCLPLVLTIKPQNCNLNTLGLAEIKILEEGNSPFAYIIKDEQGTNILESTSNDNLIEVNNLKAGNYALAVFDMEGKKTTMPVCIPLVNNLKGDETCYLNCVDYLTVPSGYTTGVHSAKKEIEIKGYVTKTETVEFNICE